MQAGVRPSNYFIEFNWAKVNQLFKSLDAAVLLLTGLFVYTRDAVEMFFFADDWNHLHDAHIANGQIFLSSWWPWVRSYRPLGFDVISLQSNLFALSPAPYHIVQLLIHLTTTCLLFALIVRLTHQRWAARAGALVFLFNKFAFQPVTWTGTLFDTLAGFFFITGLLAYIAATQSTGKKQWLLYLAACTVMAFGLRAKDQVALLPAIWFLYSVLFGPIGKLIKAAITNVDWHRPDTLIRSFPYLDFICISSAAAWCSIFYIFNSFYSADPTHPYHSSFTPSVLLKSFGWYWGELFFTSPWPEYLVIIVLIIGTFYLMLARQLRLALFGWMIWWLALLPTASLPNHYNLINYPYVPMLGIAIMAAGLVAIHRQDPAAHKYPLKVVAIALSIASVFTSIWWMQYSNETKWLRDMSVYDRQIMTELTKTVPIGTEPDTLIIIGLPLHNPFEGKATKTAQVWYGSKSLVAELANTAQIEGTASDSIIELVWNPDTLTFSKSDN
jgi:hypothetical protein